MAWYNTVGKDADTVISSRVRLARNINGYPFASRLDAAGANEMIEKVRSMPDPLALYLFTNDKAIEEKVTRQIMFGGGCINDTIIHLATSAMPFGGVGESGMGGYHGKVGFETFSHLKSIVDKKTWIDMPMRYRPYSSFKDKLIRMFMK